MVRYWAPKSTTGTFGCFGGFDIWVDITRFILHRYLSSFAFHRTIYTFEHSHDIPPSHSAADRPLPGSDALQEMPALTLQRFSGFDPGADNVAVPDLEAKLSVVQRFLFHAAYALFKHAHLFHAIQVVEKDPAVALDHHDLASFVGIRPTDVHVRENVAGIAERDKTYVVPAIPENFAAHGTDPLRRSIQQIIKDGDVMRREVPECIDVAADGTKIGPAGVQVVDPAGVLLHIFFYFADAGIKDKRMAHHESHRM